MSDDDVWNLLPKHDDGRLIIIPSPEMKRVMGNDNEYGWLPDYLRPLLGNPDQTVTSEGVYSRVWTSERIATEQPPEPIRVRDMKIVLHTTDGRATEMDWGIPTLSYSHNPVWTHKPMIAPRSMEYTFSAEMEWTAAGREWVDGLIYGLSEEARQDIGRKLLEFTECWAILNNGHRPRGSRRAARRRLSKRRQQR